MTRLLAAIMCIVVFSVLPAQGQQKGQYMPGQYGLNAGVFPDPGITYANLTINYPADSLRDSSGNAVPLVDSYDIWAIENIFYYVPNSKVLGGKSSLMAAFPTLADGALTLGSLNFPNVALSGGGFGLADTWLQPATMGWSLKRTQITPGEAFTTEWGAGQVLPLKKDMSQLLQAGVIGYDQWQVTPNGGFLRPAVPARLVPFYSVHAVGFQTNYIAPVKSFSLSFKYENEYRALARPQGREIIFGGTYTFRIPKPAPPPKP